MAAEKAVNLGLGQDFDEAIVVGVSAGAGVCTERELADRVINTGRL